MPHDQRKKQCTIHGERFPLFFETIDSQAMFTLQRSRRLHTEQALPRRRLPAVP